MSPGHLYIHVPFCLRRCTYCDFAVQPGRRPDVAGWMEAIRGELSSHFESRTWSRGERLRTIYVGGGTPSLLGPGGMRDLRDVLAAFFDLDGVQEWTAEANPESLTAALAEEWREAGVDRLSLGVQTFHEPALRWMGRLHGREGAHAAVVAARQSGFDNLSLDLIFGLPARLGRDWRADLEEVIALAPEHVSLYGLTAETGTPLGRWVAAGREAIALEDTYGEEYLLAAAMMAGHGYRHYEVSNFARPGRESQHNAAYWTGADYLGVGPGAHSFIAPVRFWNERDWKVYRRLLLEESVLAVAGEETLNEGQRGLEQLWLRLRTAEGLGRTFWPLQAGEKVDRWAAAGLAIWNDGALRLTPAGWLVLDQLAVDLSG